MYKPRRDAYVPLPPKKPKEIKAEKLEVVVSESPLFAQLISFDQRLELALSRRRLEIHDAFHLPQRVNFLKTHFQAGVLRISVQSIVKSQDPRYFVDPLLLVFSSLSSLNLKVFPSRTSPLDLNH